MFIAALGNILIGWHSLANPENTHPTGIAEVQKQGKLGES